MSVEEWASVGSSVGRYIGEVSTNQWITFAREIDRQSVAIASQCVGNVFVNHRSSIDKVSIDTRSTRKGTRILPATAKFKESISPHQKYVRITKEKTN